jgi:predicted nucleic acid-binding protein
MIVLDTNIVSEVMKTAPARQIVDWLNAQDAADLFVTAITLGEIEFGLCAMPGGQRRDALEERFEQFIARAFDGRVLAFDQAVARSYAVVMTVRRELGRPISVPDGQIAAIARTRGFAVATRNIADFEHCGVELVNPFRPGQAF